MAELAHFGFPAPFEDEHGTAAHALGVRRSFSGRAWRFRGYDAEAARALEHSGLSPVLAQVLAARGVKAADAEGFLEPRLRNLLADPYAMNDMEPAARRFVAAIEHGETIAVLGDYDVDGACSSALLLRFLHGLKRDALLYIPDRMTEGYGPSAAAMRNLRARGASLVVTVDCGAAAHDALDVAREIGLDVIVLDHHRVEKNPPAFAHVNPNGPDDHSDLTYLCAAGLTFIFLVAVQRILRASGWFAANEIDETDLLDLLDLVALATIADVVPLIGVNRAFVRQGLRKLDRLERPGLAGLAQLAAAAPSFTPYHLGFIFGPRINAGGRVGLCDLGARLLSTDDVEEAEQLAFALHRHNRERQAIEAQILESADAMAMAQSEKTFLLLSGDGWHAGVVGIVASRLKERHGKPALVAGCVDDSADGIGRGSARSVPGVDLGRIIRTAHAEGLLETGGGHAMAAGFSIRRERLAAFSRFLESQMEPQRGQIMTSHDLEIDALLSPGGATLELLADLERAGPYGPGNREPLFVFADMGVVYAGLAGANHVRLRLMGRDGAGIDAIAFRAADAPLGQALMKSRRTRIHVAGKLKRDDYGAAARVQLHLEDAAPAGA